MAVQWHALIAAPLIFGSTSPAGSASDTVVPVSVPDRPSDLFSAAVNGIAVPVIASKLKDSSAA